MNMRDEARCQSAAASRSRASSRCAVFSRCCAAPVSRPLHHAAAPRIFGLWKLLATGKLDAAIAKTLTNASSPSRLRWSPARWRACSSTAARLLRQILDPLFCDLLRDPGVRLLPAVHHPVRPRRHAPQIVIGFMMPVVAMIVNMLAGLDSVPPVLRKTARVAATGSGRDRAA